MGGSFDPIFHQFSQQLAFDGLGVGGLAETQPAHLLTKEAIEHVLSSKEPMKRPRIIATLFHADRLEIVSITAETAAQSLGLKDGKEVYAIIKATKSY